MSTSETEVNHPGINQIKPSLLRLFVQAAVVATVSTTAVVLVAKYVSPLPFSISQTTTNKETAFMVTGKSTIQTIPDKAIVSLGIQRTSGTIKVAQEQANQVINTIQQRLQEMGVKKEDIRTTDYSIQPEYDYSVSQPSPTVRIVGYSVRINVAVSLKDFEKLNTVIDMATQNGANTVDGVQFTLSEEKMRELKHQARAEAITDAQRNAAELASLSNLRLGRVMNIVEGGGQAPRPYYTLALTKDASAMESGAPTDIQPGSTMFEYSVSLSYETL